MTNVLTAVSKLVNFIMSEGMHHCQIKYFMSDMDCEYGDVLYSTEVCWLNCDRMLKGVYDFKSEIIWK
jgi:hypothetical protein